MDRIKKIKVKKSDGTFTDYIPIGVDAKYVDTFNENNLETDLNNINQNINNINQNINNINQNINNINQNINNINQNVDNINHNVDIINSNYTIMIGDSYGVGSSDGVIGKLTGWCDRVKNLLNLNDNSYIKLVEGASGFTRKGHYGHNFNTLLSSNLNNINNKELVKNIILCGGYNDRDGNIDTIINAIDTFSNLCKTNFPNANIFIGFIGNNSENSGDATTIRYNLTKVLNAYKSCTQFGINYLNNVELCMHNYSYFSTDNYHPNEIGYKALSQAIFQSFKTGNYNTNFEELSTKILENSNNVIDFSQSDFTFKFIPKNDSISVVCYNNIVFSSPQTIASNTTNLIGKIKNNYIRRNVDVIFLRGMFDFIDNSNNIKKIWCNLNFSNSGDLYITPITNESLTNIKKISGNNFAIINMLNW